GLRNKPCTSTPATASAVPARKAAPKRCARSRRKASRKLASDRSPWPTESDSAPAASAAAIRPAYTSPIGAGTGAGRLSAARTVISFDQRAVGHRRVGHGPVVGGEHLVIVRSVVAGLRLGGAIVWGGVV